MMADTSSTVRPSRGSEMITSSWTCARMSYPASSSASIVSRRQSRAVAWVTFSASLPPHVSTRPQRFVFWLTPI